MFGNDLENFKRHNFRLFNIELLFMNTNSWLNIHGVFNA